LENLRVDRRIILKCFFRKYNGAWTGFIWLRIGTNDCMCNKTSGLIKCGEFLDNLSFVSFEYTEQEVSCSCGLHYADVYDSEETGVVPYF
jgi:hypothetical protein